MGLDESWGHRLHYSGEQLAELLDKTRWTKDYTWEETLKLAEHMLAYRIEAGKVLFEEGNTDNYMSFLLKGSVCIKKSGTNLATVRAPQSLGEMCLIDGQPRSATAVANTEALLLVFTKDNYLRLAGSEPQIANKLLFKISQLLSQRLRATSHQLADYLEQ